MWLLIFVTVNLALTIIVLLFSYNKLRKNYEMLHQSYINIEKLNSTLRAQRHDYLNHLQVVYGLCEIEEYGEIKDYLSPVYKEIMKTGKAIKTSKAAINALLSAKQSEAENANIDMFIEVNSNLNDLKIPDWELCKVISNIVDNAITALSSKETDRKLFINITEDKENFIFEISNNGPAIPDRKQSEIFLEGVSTKASEGHGMGLFIVKSVINKNKGNISLKSDEDQTTFTISFPK